MTDAKGTDHAPQYRWALAALLVVGLVGGVALTEVCYRVMRRFVCVGMPSAPVWRLDSRFGWMHSPNGEGWLYGCLGRKYEWRIYTRINSHGLRDRERAYERTPGVSRVLLLGDSMTEAMQVPIDRTFATLAEADLSARGTPVEMINSGVAGYGTDNELLFFRHEGVRYAPDAVIVVFNVANDVGDNLKVLNERLYAANPDQLLPKTYFNLDAGGVLVPDPAPASRYQWKHEPIGLWEKIENRVYLIRALRRLVARMTAAPVPQAAAVPVPAPAMLPAGFTVFDVMKTPADAEWSEAWRVTEALLRELRKEVEASGARFGVVVMPSREAVSADAWQNWIRILPALSVTPHDPMAPVARITAFLEREGIPYLSLVEPLQTAAQRTGKMGFNAWDVHLDTNGHAVVANALEPFVSKLVSR